MRNLKKIDYLSTINLLFTFFIDYLLTYLIMSTMFMTKSLKEVSDKYDRMIAELEREREREMERVKEEEKKALGLSGMKVKELKHLAYNGFLTIPRGTRKTGLVKMLEKRYYEERILTMPEDLFGLVIEHLDKKDMSNFSQTSKTSKKRVKQYLNEKKEIVNVEKVIKSIHVCSNNF